MAINKYGIFDVLGPIMIGPSSSHTAGAARLGKISKEIVGEKYDEVKFLLHGSFAKTYRGHGTDRALAAGVLGMDPGDEKLRYALELADKENIKIIFEEVDLGDYQHPNTVKSIFRLKSGEEISITGSSTGGGSILITNIDGTEVNLTGNKPTLIVKYQNEKGTVTNITKVLANNNIDISIINVERSNRRDEAIMIIEGTDSINPEITNEIGNFESVILTRFINPA